jgi:hypothetical protein
MAVFRTAPEARLAETLHDGQKNRATIPAASLVSIARIRSPFGTTPPGRGVCLEFVTGGLLGPPFDDPLPQLLKHATRAAAPSKPKKLRGFIALSVSN